MICNEIDPEGMTWQQAHDDHELQEVYNDLLHKHGYVPIIRKATASAIHGAADWSHCLMYPVTHRRDVYAMKWKLYQTCLIRSYDREQCCELEEFARARLSVTH